MMDAAQTIAQGGQPAWEDTFEHPEHGPLKFTGKMPTGGDVLRMSVVQEALAPGLTQGMGALLAQAAAAMQTGIIEPPVIREDRDQDPENADHVKITLVRYDPLVDENTQFPVDVWIAFYHWRAELLSERTKDTVKNSSGATSSAPADAASPATSGSLPTA